MSKELYNAEGGKYNMFKDIYDEEELKKYLSELDDNTVLAIKLPERLDEYSYILDERKQRVVGIYDYEEVRSGLFYTHGEDDSVEGKIFDIIEKLTEFDEAIVRIENIAKSIDEKYDKIMKAIGHIKIDVSVKEYVGE